MPKTLPDKIESPRVAAEPDFGPGVTLRVVALSLFLTCLFAWVIPVVDYKFFNTFLGATHLPPGALGTLLILMLVVNPLLRVLGRKGFSQNEILTVYMTCLFSTLIVGIGGNNYWVSFIIGCFYFATPENKWLDHLQTMPSWMTPALWKNGTYDKTVVEGWYNGTGGVIPWDAWLVPLLAWGALFFASFIMLGSLSVMLRAQWGEREALAFPLMRLPLELTEGIDDKDAVFGKFFRNPLMWIGFGIAVVIQGLNGLNLYYPDIIPKVPLELNSGALFSEPPWNQMGGTPVRVWPIAIGIAYLLTSEISFSLWFFYWFIKFQLIGAYYLGFPPNSLPNQIETSQKAFIGFQETGAHLAFVGMIFWIGREHFGHILRRAFRRAPMGETEKHEAMSYPAAFWSFIGSFAFLVGWTIYAGVMPLLALSVWIGYLVIAIVVTRVVADGGLIFVHHGWMPLGAMASVMGAGPGFFLSPANGIVVASVLESACIQDYRGSLMPSFIQSFKLARDRRIEGRKLGALVFSVVLIGLVAGTYMNVRLGYDNGGLGLQGWLAQWGPQMTGRQAAAMANGFSGRDVSLFNLFWLCFGAGLTILVMWCRSQFLWFPLHPLGYMMCVAYPMHTFWASIFIGWACKVLISRYGGADSYRRMIPSFLGLALGDVSMMLLWLAIDGWQLRQGHQLMPG